MSTHTHTHNSTLCTAFNMLPSLLDAAGHAGCPLKIPTRPCGVYATNWHVVAPTASGGTPNKYTTIYMYTRIWCMCWDFLNFWHFSIHLKKCHIVCREREGERQTRRMRSVDDQKDKQRYKWKAKDKLNLLLRKSLQSLPTVAHCCAQVVVSTRDCRL